MHAVSGFTGGGKKLINYFTDPWKAYPEDIKGHLPYMGRYHLISKNKYDFQSIGKYTKEIRIIKKALFNEKNLKILEGSVEDLSINKQRDIRGVILSDGSICFANSVILTTGTFLNGVIHIGSESFSAGRIGEKPSIGLSTTLDKLGFRLGRLKTGTPPRILKKSINFNNLTEQVPDKCTIPFSFIHRLIQIPQISCYITHTNKNTHKIIQENLHLSPMYSGDIKAKGLKSTCRGANPFLVNIGTLDSDSVG